MTYDTNNYNKNYLISSKSSICDLKWATTKSFLLFKTGKMLKFCTNKSVPFGPAAPWLWCFCNQLYCSLTALSVNGVGWNIQRTLFDVFKLYLGEIRGENRFCDSLIFPVNQLDKVGGFQVNRCWNVILSDKITSLICSLAYTSYLHYYKIPLMRVRGG